MANSELLVIADENMPAVEDLFGHLGEVRRVPGRSLSAEQVKDADILLVRSVSKVDEALLSGSKVKFVGTATIGTDHVDTDWLAEQGIAFSAAPGCNAEAVVDYVLASLLWQAAEQDFSLASRTVGIIGVGNVGGRLAERLQAMGISVLLNDPPRAEVESGFVGLDDLLSKADIVCMHTPLTRTGDHPSYHLMDAGRLAQLKPGAILLNAGRGPAIDNSALLALMPQRPDLTLILDVWEHEPLVDAELAQYCAIATPHIAGYSQDGKIRGTWMLYDAWRRFTGSPAAPVLGAFLAASPFEQIQLNEDVQLLDLVRLCYDPYRDDRALRQTLHLPPAERSRAFDRLRKQYPLRRELATLKLVSANRQQRALLKSAGFSVDC